MPKYWVKNYFAHGSFPEVGQKQKTEKKRDNTPGTAGGPGGRDRTLTVKSRKTAEKSAFFRKKIQFTHICICIYLLVMPKYWGKNYFARGSFPEVVQKQKTEKKREKEGRKNESW